MNESTNYIIIIPLTIGIALATLYSSYSSNSTHFYDSKSLFWNSNTNDTITVSREIRIRLMSCRSHLLEVSGPRRVTVLYITVIHQEN
jgi:hypothetical protein